MTRRQACSAAAVLAVAALAWAGRLLRLARSVGAHADHWSELGAQRRGPEGGLLYVALGDSATQGIGASRPDRGYVGLVAQRLQAATGAPVQVVNLSVSGARTADVVDRQLPALAALGREPDLVTVAVGGNDVRAYDGEAFASAADRLTAGLPAGSFVADVPHFGHGRWERDAQQAADALASGVRRQRLRLVPLHEAMRDQGWRGTRTQYAADGFHPDYAGHRVWADAFWAEVEPVLRAGDLGDQAEPEAAAD